MFIFELWMFMSSRKTYSIVKCASDNHYLLDLLFFSHMYMSGKYTAVVWNVEENI